MRTGEQQRLVEAVRKCWEELRRDGVPREEVIARLEDIEQRCAPSNGARSSTGD